MDTTRPQGTIKYDGRDKIASTKTIVTRMDWAAGSRTMMAGSVAMSDTDYWGTDYRSPVGINIPDATAYQIFNHSAFAIMAGPDGATISVDTKAYLDQTSVSTARSELFDAFAGTTLLMNYLGHGGVGRLADESLLTTDDVPSLQPAGALPIVTVFTCLAGEYGLPGYDSLGEALIKQAGAGAAAVLAPSAVEDNDASALLARYFMNGMLSVPNRVVLGKVVQASLKAAATAGAPPQMLRTYNLMGDPALRVKW
jgi:hypothetical protein